MNIGGMKDLLMQSVVPDSDKQVKKLNVDSSQLLMSSSIFRSSYSQASNGQVAFRAVSISMHQNLVINGKAVEEAPPPEEEKSAFDFEAVAKNVLDFVSSSIGKAQARGASDDEVASLMAQARQGIDTGFAEAREELGKLGMMDEELAEGIDKGFALIQQGLDELETDLLGEQDTVKPALGAFAVAQAASYERKDTASIEIRTKDGDTVKISFADIQKYQEQSQYLAAGQLPNSEGELSDVEGRSGEGGGPSHALDGHMQDALAAYGEHQNATQFDYNLSEKYQEKGSLSYQSVGDDFAAQGSSQYEYNEALNFSFSVDGELDVDERAAISDLMGKMGSLSNTFFNGDLDKAFNQALELGFDDKELAGFSLDFKKVETIQVAQSYQKISPQPQVTDTGMPAFLEELKSYLQDLTAVGEQTNKLLDGADQFDKLMQEVLKHQFDFTEDQLKKEQERFSEFNNRMLDVLSELGE